MHWKQLLTQQRLGMDALPEYSAYRSTFQKDFDRLVFSAAFRRLQDKTQVFPLAKSDYVRTRLTHSLEVSSVARSLGTLAGEHIITKHQLEEISPQDVGAILAASALAHDIGNPPFGHAGEEAISRFFEKNALGQQIISEMQPEERDDFLKFEGNAQGFRLITKLQNSDNVGGLQLSLATIGSVVKYPRPSALNIKQLPDTLSPQNVALKKFNYFYAEKDLFENFAKQLGLISYGKGIYARHPLSFLLEAADDICYRLIDIEDAYRLGILPETIVREHYENIIKTTHSIPAKVQRIKRMKDQIEYLRSYAIGVLVEQVSVCFIEQEKNLLEGRCEQELLALIPAALSLEAVRNLGFQRVYASSPVLEVGIAGFEVLNHLLTEFVSALNDEANGKGHKKSRMLVNLLPDQFLGNNRLPDEDPYLRMLKITDFLSGMTDTYAVHVFKTISGINLPG